MYNIGNNLKIAIKNSKYSQKDIAKILKISEDTMTNYMKDNTLPKIDIFVKICEIINMPIDKVVYGSCINNDETSLLLKFNKLDNEQKNKVIEYIEMLDNKNRQMSHTSVNTRDVEEEKNRTG